MNAYSSASGGAMFIPQKIARKTSTMSYSEFAGEARPHIKTTSFGKRQTEAAQPISKIA